VTCREFNLLLAEHGPASLPADARAHAASCAACARLLSALGAAEDPAPLDPALAAGIAGRLATGLQPVRPLPPAGYFAAAFVLLFAALAAVIGFGLGDHALVKMTPQAAAETFAPLGSAAILLALALSAAMAPAAPQHTPPLRLAATILLVLAFVFVAAFPVHAEPAFWLRAWRCLRIALAAGALSSLLIWLIARRGAILAPSSAGALAGLLGGLTGTTALQIHCPNFNGAHILAGHWAAALAGAAIGWLTGRIAARRAPA
jgi:hypothetical protein